jgi:hypothetical protein
MGHLPDASARSSVASCAKTHLEAHDMANVEFDLETPVPPAAVLAAAVDFSDRRPDLWPTIERRVYRVHARGDTWAEVTEGSRFLGTIWARERYDWSTPGCVCATVLDSNVFRPGGTWELAATERDGRTKVTVTSRRKARGTRGRILGTVLSLAGPSILAGSLTRTLNLLAEGRSTAGLTAR